MVAKCFFMWVWLGLAVVLLALVPLGSQAFKDGAPLYACEFMKPGTRQGGVTGDEGHVTQSQNDLPTYGNSRFPPFHIVIQGEALTYSPGMSYQLSIVANQSMGSNMFKGVLLMARSVTCASSSPSTIEVTNNAIGSFSVPSISALKTLDCFEIVASAVTHSTPQYKINETITWRAPDSSSGNLVFKATIVHGLTTYWTDLYSPILRDASVEPPRECSATKNKLSSFITPGLFTIVAILLSERH